MFLIVTMAGRYQRFLNEGFKTPKYLLPWGEQTILAVILSELNKDKVFSDVVLLANQRDDAYMPHVRAVMKSHDIDLDNLILSQDTSGQTETALLGIKALEKKHGEVNTPIVIHNIDTILLNRNLKTIEVSLKLSAGYIDIFGANNKGYSYVLIDENKKVIEITEKIVVSDLATSGLYAFKNSQIFKQYSSENDIFVSSIFKRMITNGESVVSSEKHKENETIVLGTPEEYMNASLTLLDLQ
jgi:NDP-sugar pyrophosphorylase family protein